LPFKLKGIEDIAKNYTMLKQLFEEIKSLDPTFDEYLSNPLAINKLIDGWISAYLDGRTPDLVLSESSI